MPKTLILTRHTKAESFWESPTQKDHERPLTAIGKACAENLGNWLKEQKLIPSQALVSSAKRTQQTFEALSLPLEPVLTAQLFNASSDTLLDAIDSAEGDTLLIVAHNPGIGDLAFRFARMMRQLPEHPLFEDYPTGATLVIQWNTESWRNLDYSQGNILDFTIPQ